MAAPQGEDQASLPSSCGQEPKHWIHPDTGRKHSYLINPRKSAFLVASEPLEYTDSIGEEHCQHEGHGFDRFKLIPKDTMVIATSNQDGRIDSVELEELGLDDWAEIPVGSDALPTQREIELEKQVRHLQAQLGENSKVKQSHERRLNRPMLLAAPALAVVAAILVRRNMAT